MPEDEPMSADELMPRDKPSPADESMAEAERGMPPGDEPMAEAAPNPGDEPMSAEELMPRDKSSPADESMAEAERGMPPDAPMPEPPRDGLRLSSSDPELPGVWVAGCSGANVVERRGVDEDDPAVLGDPAGLSRP